MSKAWLWILIIVVIAFVLWKIIGNGGGGTAEDPEAQKATFVIIDHPTVPTACKISAEGGGSDVYVRPGEWVYFRNDSSMDRTFQFGPARRLFDVNSLNVASGETDSLRIADDADAPGRVHPHTFQSCHQDVGPPKIIVCPPGSTGPTC